MVRPSILLTAAWVQPSQPDVLPFCSFTFLLLLLHLLSADPRTEARNCAYCVWVSAPVGVPLPHEGHDRPTHLQLPSAQPDEELTNAARTCWYSYSAGAMASCVTVGQTKYTHKYCNKYTIPALAYIEIHRKCNLFDKRFFPRFLAPDFHSARGMT